MKGTIVGDADARKRLNGKLSDLLARLGRELGVENCSLSVLLTDDPGIRDYNRRFRNRDEPTDVLSFPTGSGDPQDAGHYLGDLVISLDSAEAQAAELGHDTAAEVEVLILHGVLHLLGHDHETDDGAMREIEARLARQLFGSPRGLIERSEDGGPEDSGAGVVPDGP